MFPRRAHVRSCSGANGISRGAIFCVPWSRGFPSEGRRPAILLATVFAVAAAPLGGCTALRQPPTSRDAAPAAVSTSGDTAALILRFGQDTAAVDRVAWAGAPATGLTMTGRAVVAHTMTVAYRVALDGDGLVTIYAFELGPPARAVVDSVTFAPPLAGNSVGVVGRGRVPLWNATPGLYDVLLRNAHARLTHARPAAARSRAETVSMPLFRFGAASPRDTAFVTFMGPDSARVVLHTDGAPSLELRARVDEMGRLVRAEALAEGWTVERAPALLASAYALAPSYGAPAGAPYVAEEVRLDVGGGVTLGGTLTRPRAVGASGRVPAVVLLHGSTASDRNNSRLPLPGLFWQLADTLGRRGIAVLRYDQRGIGESSGASDSATVQVRAADARAALAYLRRRTDVDPARLGVRVIRIATRPLVLLRDVHVFDDDARAFFHAHDLAAPALVLAGDHDDFITLLDFLHDFSNPSPSRALQARAK